MRELSQNELDNINGGVAWYVALGGAAAYMAIIDYSMQFGAGLGSGLYDAIHHP